MQVARMRKVQRRWYGRWALGDFERLSAEEYRAATAAAKAEQKPPAPPKPGKQAKGSPKAGEAASELPDVLTPEQYLALPEATRAKMRVVGKKGA